MAVCFDCHGQVLLCHTDQEMAQLSTAQLGSTRQSMQHTSSSGVLMTGEEGGGDKWTTLHHREESNITLKSQYHTQAHTERRRLPRVRDGATAMRAHVQAQKKMPKSACQDERRGGLPRDVSMNTTLPPQRCVTMRRWSLPREHHHQQQQQQTCVQMFVLTEARSYTHAAAVISKYSVHAKVQHVTSRARRVSESRRLLTHARRRLR